MIIEIEYYKGDIILCGKNMSLSEFKRQIDFVKSVYGYYVKNFRVDYT